MCLIQTIKYTKSTPSLDAKSSVPFKPIRTLP